MAETSVTIDDIIIVIDAGQMKEKSYDGHMNISTLQTSWISRANALQRRGRAGRVQPGICFHLFSEEKFDNELYESQAPEMLRTPLEELILQIPTTRMGLGYVRTMT